MLGDPATAPISSSYSTISCTPFTTYVGGNNTITALTPNRDLGADSMAVSYTAQLAQTVTDYDGAW